MTFASRREVVLPDHPVLLIALDGWIDAGFAGLTAANAILDVTPTEVLAEFNVGDLIDQRARRPRMRVSDGLRETITWPELRLLVGSDGKGDGVAILLGPEPDYHWGAFVDEVAEFAAAMDTRLVVGIAGFPAAVPHTRAVRLASVSSDEALVRKVGFIPNSVDIPIGIADAIMERCADRGIGGIHLWARVPHYVAGAPYPPAALGLIEGVQALSGLEFDVRAMRHAADESRVRIDALISQSTDHVEMVRQLESQVDTVEFDIAEAAADLPSGDEIAAELERYLRGEP